MYKIEKDIPTPEKSDGQYAKYPFGQMEIGDSFFIDINEYRRFKAYHSKNYSSLANRVRSAAKWYKTRHQEKIDFTVRIIRSEKNGGCVGFRCWRTV